MKIKELSLRPRLRNIRTHIRLQICMGYTLQSCPIILSHRYHIIMYVYIYSLILYTHYIDINECKQAPSPCDQLCRNDKGSFQCYCKDGYELNDTTSLCQSEFQ